MQSKFIDILQTFSEKEFKSFESWLKSPWTNTNKGLIVLVQKLTKYHPTYNHRLLTKERLYRQIMPGKTYNADMLNNLLSQGYLQAKKFLICERFLQEESLSNRLLRKELEARDLEVDYFKNVDKEVDRLEGLEIKSWEDHAEIFQLHREVYHYPNQTVRVNPGSETILKMNKGIDIVFLLEKAAIINEMIVRERIVKGEKYDVEEQLEVWNKMAEDVNHPSIELYKLRFGYEKGDIYEQYEKLKKLFFESFALLNYKEQKIHLISLINDYRLVNEETNIDFGEMLPLYKLGLDSGVLLNKGKISRSSFVTIVSVSNHMEDFDFSYNFIEEYHKKLSNEVQEDGRNYGIAQTLYRQGRLEECIDILTKKDFKTDHFQLVSRLVNIQVHFDLYLKDDSYYSYFFSTISAVEKWIQREKKHSHQYKLSFMRFIQKCRLLATIYIDVNFREESLSKFLVSGEMIQGKNWLIKRYEMVLSAKRKKRAT